MANPCSTHLASHNPKCWAKGGDKLAGLPKVQHQLQRLGIGVPKPSELDSDSKLEEIWNQEKEGQRFLNEKYFYRDAVLRLANRLSGQGSYFVEIR